jgi:hypothetical protein
MTQDDVGHRHDPLPIHFDERASKRVKLSAANDLGGAYVRGK